MDTIIILAVSIGCWVLSLVIAFWIIRAGVQGGVQQLVEQNRQTQAILQSQHELLRRLVGPDAPKPAPAIDGSAVSAWDKLQSS